MAEKTKIGAWIISSVKISFIFAAVFWAVEAIQLLGFELYGFGILPRSTEGLMGIVTSPFVHAGPKHLLANTIPFLVLIFLLFLFYRKKAFFILLVIWLVTGILTWLIGRMAWHIGASGIIYGLASFLVFNGILSRNLKLFIPALIVTVFYSGLIFGIFPNNPQISWEGHLSGAVSGLICTIIFPRRWLSMRK